MRRTACTLVAFALLGNLTAQAWRQVDGPRQTMRAMTYDSARQRILALDQRGELFTADDDGWVHAASMNTLLGVELTMAHDPARRRTVAVLRIAGTRLQTYEWDGFAWSGRTSVNTPNSLFPPFQVTYTPQHGILLTVAPSATTIETWSWDGVDWHLLAQSGLPAMGQLAYDSLRNRVQSVTNGALCEWNGTAWTQRAVPTGFGNVNGIAYDAPRQRSLVSTSSGNWEFDGTNWTRASTAQPWLDLAGTQFVYCEHRGRIVAVHPGDIYTAGGKIAEWTGTTWVTSYEPPLHGRLALHPPSGLLVSFGGNALKRNADTWTHDGMRWHRLAPAHSPTTRNGHSMWHDGHDVWLFGGLAGDGLQSDETWRWNGIDWTLVPTATAPSPRDGTAIAFDPVRQRAVAFGGSTATGFVNDTWEFDGVNWSQLAPPVSPSVRAYAAIAYEPTMARIVMCQGQAPNVGHRLDCWRWDGQQWTTFVTTPQATIFGQQSLAFDPARQRLVLAYPGTGPISIWDLVGLTWVQQTGPSGVSTISGDMQLTTDANGNLAMFAENTFWRRSTAVALPVYLGGGCGSPPIDIGLRSYPYLGTVGNAIEVTYQPNQVALLLAADTPTSIGLGGGCTQFVPLGQFGFLLFTGPTGLAQLPLSIPAEPALRGAQLYLQAATPQATPAGYALSNGIRINVGD